MKKLYRIDPCCRCLCATCQRGRDEDNADCCTHHQNIACPSSLLKGETQTCPDYKPIQETDSPCKDCICTSCQRYPLGDCCQYHDPGCPSPDQPPKTCPDYVQKEDSHD